MENDSWSGGGAGQGVSQRGSDHVPAAKKSCSITPGPLTAIQPAEKENTDLLSLQDAPLLYFGTSNFPRCLGERFCKGFKFLHEQTGRQDLIILSTLRKK